MDGLILVTRLLALGLYAGTFFYAVSTLRCCVNGNWPGKITLWIVLILSGYWTFSYVWIIVDTWDALVWPGNTGFIAMLTRVGHYATAIGMYVIVSFVRTVATRYNIEIVNE